MLPRHAATTRQKQDSLHPVMVVTGHRQSDKTTLCRAVFTDKPQVSLDFLVSGLAGHLLGISHTETLVTHAMRAALFETWLVSEFLKAAHNAGKMPALWFWRDGASHEVDLLTEQAGGLKAIEIKSGITQPPTGSMGWNASAASPPRHIVH